MIKLAIDPNRRKSGVAYIHSKDNKINISDMRLWDLFSKLKSGSLSLMVYIKADWIKKEANFNTLHGQNKTDTDKLVRRLGEDYATGKQIADFCVFHQINYVLVSPEDEIWSNPPIKHDEVLEKLRFQDHNLKPITNQPTRNAIILLLDLIKNG
ncbi:MAG: hypothetical protein ACE1ZQ_09650 [Ignavibacteriaceae bacterium]